MITYRGHTNNHGSQHFVDYREGPIYERQPDGSVKQIRGTRDPREIFSEVHRFGGWTQVNHPTIFPPVSPARRRALPRLLLGVLRRRDRLVEGRRVRGRHRPRGHRRHPEPVHRHGDRALRRADSGRATRSRRSAPATRTRRARPTARSTHRSARRAPSSTPNDLSERGIRCGVLGRHTYAKVAGAGAADVRLDARPWGAVVVEARDHRRHGPRQGRQLHRARARRQRPPAPDRQGRRDGRDRAGHERRLHLPLRRARAPAAGACRSCAAA